MIDDHRPTTSRSRAREFLKGYFAVHKSCKEFSSVAIDQVHEQNSAVIKDAGGAIGSTEDPTALRRWMIAGPEESHLIARYEKLRDLKMQQSVASITRRECSNNIH